MQDLKPGDRVTLKPIAMTVTRHTAPPGHVWVQPDGPGERLIPTAWVAEPVVMAGEWEKNRIRDGYPTLDVRPYPGPHIAGMVAVGGWCAYDPADNPIDAGPETGQQGRDCVDACLREHGHLPPVPEWVPAVGDRVETSSGIGVLRLIQPMAEIEVGRMTVRVPLLEVRPAPKPPPKVAPAWVRCDGAWIRRGVCWVRDSGGCHAPPSIPVPPRGEPIAVRRARMDAHLLVQGYTLEGGPVEGVKVHVTYRPSATIADVQAFEATLRDPECRAPRLLACIPYCTEPLVVDGASWSNMAAWLIAHPEAPIEWTIEVAS